MKANLESSVFGDLSDIKPYRLIEEEESIKIEALKTEQKYPASHSSLNSPAPSNGQIHINFGLKYLLIAIDSQPIDQAEKNAQKLAIIDSKMTKSKWFDIERIGQDELYEELEKVLQDLKNFTPYSLPFQNRVSKKEAPDYYDIVQTPMDLSTMYKKLKSSSYQNKNEFIQDLNLIFSNCYLYNTDVNSPLRLYAECLREKWIVLMRKVPNIQIRSKEDLSDMLNCDFSKEPERISNEPKSLSESQNLHLSSYQRFLLQREKRLQLPFGDQPACIRSGFEMGQFDENDEFRFFCNSFPPSSCLHRPQSLFSPPNKRAKVDSFLREEATGLVANVNSINMIRHLKSKIDQIKEATATDFGKAPVEGLVEWNVQIIESASFRRTSYGRPMDMKNDCLPIVKRFIGLFCANFGYQSVQMSALHLFADIFYDYLCSITRTFAVYIEEQKGTELNLTEVAALSLRSLSIEPRELLVHLRNGHKKHSSKVQDIAKRLEKQYFSLLKVPTGRENDSDFEEGEQNEDFLLIGEVNGDDLGLDMLCLKELGLPSNIPKSLVRPKAQQKEKASLTPNARYKFVPFLPIDCNESLVGVLAKYTEDLQKSTLGTPRE
jgi:hypothetical protein